MEKNKFDQLQRKLTSANNNLSLKVGHSHPPKSNAHKARLNLVQSALTSADKQPVLSDRHADMQRRFDEVQTLLREEAEQKWLDALEQAVERERQRREALERARLEEAQRVENERREKIRENPRPIKLRKFADKRVTVLYALFQDCFPEGGGFTRDGMWVDEQLSERARQVIQPCFDGEPEFKPLTKKLLKLIHVDTGDHRLSTDERSRVFQLFYESCVNTIDPKPKPRQEDTICL